MGGMSGVVAAGAVGGGPTGEGACGGGALAGPALGLETVRDVGDLDKAVAVDELTGEVELAGGTQTVELLDVALRGGCDLVRRTGDRQQAQVERHCGSTMTCALGLDGMSDRIMRPDPVGKAGASCYDGRWTFSEWPMKISIEFCKV